MLTENNKKMRKQKSAAN